MTAHAFAVAIAALGVNGPTDVVPSWDTVNWRLHEDNVRRLRQRIFRAVQDGDLAKARNLQKLMLRSWSNTLVSVRQATQRNAGRETAGIDGEVALTSPARMAMAVRVHQSVGSWQPRAVKRVYIPKAGNRRKLRPLGIPTVNGPASRSPSPGEGKKPLISPFGGIALKRQRATVLIDLSPIMASSKRNATTTVTRDQGHAVARPGW